MVRLLTQKRRVAGGRVGRGYLEVDGRLLVADGVVAALDGVAAVGRRVRELPVSHQRTP